jgi:hypothetical protein
LAAWRCFAVELVERPLAVERRDDEPDVLRVEELRLEDELLRERAEEPEPRLEEEDRPPVDLAREPPPDERDRLDDAELREPPPELELRDRPLEEPPLDRLEERPPDRRDLLDPDDPEEPPLLR